MSEEAGIAAAQGAGPDLEAAKGAGETVAHGAADELAYQAMDQPIE